MKQQILKFIDEIESYTDSDIEQFVSKYKSVSTFYFNNIKGQYPAKIDSLERSVKALEKNRSKSQFKSIKDTLLSYLNFSLLDQKE